MAQSALHTDRRWRDWRDWRIGHERDPFETGRFFLAGGFYVLFEPCHGRLVPGHGAPPVRRQLVGAHPARDGGHGLPVVPNLVDPFPAHSLPRAQNLSMVATRGTIAS